MNEAEAMRHATDDYVIQYADEYVKGAAIDFEAGWQAAIEWQRSQCEPYLWMTEWWIEGGPDNGEYEYETNHSNEFSCGRKDGFPLYRHPPTAQINQQLVRALELAETEMRYAGWDFPVLDNLGRVGAYKAIIAALAAAKK